MEILNTIFGGKTRVRVLRLFLLNPEKVFDVRSVVVGSRGKRGDVEREMAGFEKAGLVKRRRYQAEGRKGRKITLMGWGLNTGFIYLKELRGLLLNDVLLKGEALIKKLSRTGTLKLVVLSGIFIQDWDSRVDVLVVGEKLKRGMLERILHHMEGEIGRELRYALLDTIDFQYRLSIGDKLVRDILDNPHQVVLNKSVLG